MKKFKKDFLREVLKFNEEDVKLTMECQKMFPELLENEGRKIESAKKLYGKIGLNETHWASWSKRNIINNEFFKENVDWGIRHECENLKNGKNIGGRPTRDFYISVEFAKHLVMMARTDSSHKFRQYFIVIEKAIRGNQDHISTREPEKKSYNKMKEEIIKDYSKKHSIITEMDKKYLMIRECNMINQNLLGYTASEVRSKLGYLDKQTREHLVVQQNKVIDELQNIITGLIIAEVSFEERSKIIQNICKNKYSNLKMD